MYYVLVGVQLLAIFFSVFSTVLLVRLQSSIENRYLFICAICIDVYSVGYLQEMLLRTVDGIRAALAFEYCGLAFAAFNKVNAGLNFRIHTAFSKMSFV